MGTWRIRPRGTRASSRKNSAPTAAATLAKSGAYASGGVVRSILERARQRYAERLVIRYESTPAPRILAHPPEIEHALLSVLDLAARHTTSPTRVRLQVGTWSEVRSSAEGLGPHRHVALGVTCAGPRWMHPFDDVEDSGRLRPALEVVRATLERQAGALFVQDDYEWGNHLTLVWPV